MIKSISFLHAAEIEAADAIDWYEEKESGLGTSFREAIETTIEAIRNTPSAFPIVQGTWVRRALTQRFPYSIIYTNNEDAILIIAVFHSSRNPIVWRGRI